MPDTTSTPAAPDDPAPTSTSIESRLAMLGLVLPRPPKPIGRFVYGVEHGGLLYLSGTYGTVPDGDVDVLPICGRVGSDLTIDDGYASARLVALNQLAMAKAILGSLDRIERVLRLEGWVNAAPEFQDAPSVLNGASDLYIDVFGDARGRHARSALYQQSLARNAPVAAQTTFAVRP